MIGNIGHHTANIHAYSAQADLRSAAATQLYQSVSALPGKVQASDNVALSDEEKKQVAELKKRDQEVRAHEQAHKSAGGQYVMGGANYSYQTGPDGKRYAVGGEVQIDVSKVKGDPDATIRKMQQVRKAALAPANPSSQDRNVAALATQVEAEAVRELAQQKQAGNFKSDVNNSRKQFPPFTAYSADATYQQSSMTGQQVNISA